MEDSNEQVYSVCTTSGAVGWELASVGETHINVSRHAIDPQLILDGRLVTFLKTYSSFSRYPYMETTKEKLDS